MFQHKSKDLIYCEFQGIDHKLDTTNVPLQSLYLKQ